MQIMIIRCGDVDHSGRERVKRDVATARHSSPWPSGLVLNGVSLFVEETQRHKKPLTVVRVINVSEYLTMVRVLYLDQEPASR
jgi:hypothetical protein